MTHEALAPPIRSRCRPPAAVAVAACLILLSPCHLVTLSPCQASSTWSFDEVIDSPMYRDPDLPRPRVVKVFPEGAKALWLRALERPEAEMRYRAAGAIAEARRRGMKGLETTVAPLVAALDRRGEHPEVRLAVARALITLDAREAAPSFLRQARSGGGELGALVEPALARWRYRPAGALWLGRVGDPEAPRRSLVRAIRGLAALGEAKAADTLRALALSKRVEGPVRLEAATALGSLRTEGLEGDARRLAADPSARGLVGRLAAAALLSKHDSKEAVGLLQRLVKDPEPAVASTAAARLIEIDPGLLVSGPRPQRSIPAAERDRAGGEVGHLLASPDAKLRSLGVEVLFRRPGDKHVGLLAGRLDDPHRGVRRQARRALHALAGKKEFRKQVLAAATEVLAGKKWRGQEQAAILLTQLGHKPAAGRLVELLNSDRPEVFVSAAWALRELAVPQTLPAVLRYVKDETRFLLAGKHRPGREGMPLAFADHQVAQLNQLLGRQKYRPADAALRRFIPRIFPPEAPEARAAAAWALGLLHEGEADAPFVTALEERLNDTASFPPEDPRVRGMSALTLGRLKAKKALPSLRKHFWAKKPARDMVNNACGWAIGLITGKGMPAPGTVRSVQGGWFLAPSP
jgi:HEAT repeat protein